MTARSRAYGTALLDAFGTPTTVLQLAQIAVAAQAVIDLADQEQEALRAQHAAAQERLADYESIDRAVERSRALVLEHTRPDGTPVAGRPLHVLVDSDGWGGLLHVHDDLVADVDGTATPLVRWDLPMWRAAALLDALAALDEIGDILAAHNGEGPNGWTPERSALAEALEHLVRTGRVTRDDESGQLRLPDAGTAGGTA